MTLVILLRHAHSTANGSGVLAGRTGGVHLSPLGRVQARKLATRLGEIPLKSLRSSPLERCAETLHPWLRKRELSDFPLMSELTIDHDLAEVDYGLWSGMKLRTLSRDPLWKTVQERPSQVTFPQGESLLAMQKRAMKSVDAGLSLRGKGHVLLMSHGDVVKSIIASALGMHLDEFQRIVIDPASVSIVDYSGSRPRVLLLNDSRSKLDSSVIAQRGKKDLVGGGAGTTQKKGVS